MVIIPSIHRIRITHPCLEFVIGLFLIQCTHHGTAMQYDWKISNFNQLSYATGESIHSKGFTAPSSYGEILLFGKIYPHGKTDSDYISLYLKLSNIPGGINSVTVAYKFSIISSNGENYAKFNSIVRNISTRGPSYGYSKFMKREEAMQYIDSDGSITFRYSVNCLDGTPLLPESSISVVSNDTVIWSIQKFNNLLEAASTNKFLDFYQYQSNYFTVANHKWRLLLYPMGRGQLALDNISLYLELKGNLQNNPIPAVITFSIINLNGVKSNIYIFYYTFRRIHDWRGNDLFISQQDIYDPRLNMLTKDDTLKVSVTVQTRDTHSTMPVTTPISVHSTLNHAKPSQTVANHKQPVTYNTQKSETQAEPTSVNNQPPQSNSTSVNQMCGQSSVNKNRAFFGSWPPYGRYKRRIALTAGRVIRGEYPYQASLRIREHSGDSSRRCGAAILGEYWLVTAAHCFIANQDYIIRVGDYDESVYEDTEQEFNIDHYIIHPLYAAAVISSSGDIAVIKIKPMKGKGIIFNMDSQPFCLPGDAMIDLPNIFCIISGWGDMLSPRTPQDHTLRMAGIQPIKPNECNELFDLSLSNSMFCGISLDDNANDSCYGDSGDPLACEIDGHYILLGITTHGSGPNWGSVNRPGVYISIVAYKGWIKSMMIRDINPNSLHH